MASYQQALSGFFGAMQQDTDMSAYSFFGPTEYPESVAFWHDPSAIQLPLSAPSFASKQPISNQPASDHKKHKRTRSGCFTCRSRRIKCDESRPICERCRRGNRDCAYPLPNSSKAASRAAAKSRAHASSLASDSSSRADINESSPLEPIIDEQEPQNAGPVSPTNTGAGLSQTDLHRTQSWQSLRKPSVKQVVDSVSFKLDPGSPPSSESSPFESVSVRSASVSQTTADLLNSAQLPEDVRFYLNFHGDFLTNEHFFLRRYSSRFIHLSLIELALGYEPLLYALVGFSAYHHALNVNGGRLYTFLKYYNKALVLLRKSLGSGEEHTEATLCTVLVLTTFEEYIGDWVNLVEHHQAAHALMQELLTPESSNHDELHTNIFLWYARFDVVVGILAGTEAILGRNWYLAKEEYDAEQAALNPGDPIKQLALVASINRRFGLDMASLYAKLSRGMIPYQDFIEQNDQLGETIKKAMDIMRKFDDSEWSVQIYPNKQPLTENDIVDPYVPGRIHRGALWDANYIWIDLLSTEAMYKYQTMLAVKRPLLLEISKLAFEQCQIIETIDRWPEKVNGAFIGFKNSIGLASMFLPRDMKHEMWARRKMAKMEQHGYIIAPRFRDALAAIWQCPDLHRWWLPNDEGFSDIVREIRSISDERMKLPRDDDFREDVRDMKSLFWKLNVNEGEDEQSPSSSHHNLG